MAQTITFNYVYNDDTLFSPDLLEEIVFTCHDSNGLLTSRFQFIVNAIGKITLNGKLYKPLHLEKLINNIINNVETDNKFVIGDNIVLNYEYNSLHIQSNYLETWIRITPANRENTINQFVQLYNNL